MLKIPQLIGLFGFNQCFYIFPQSYKSNGWRNGSKSMYQRTYMRKYESPSMVAWRFCLRSTAGAGFRCGIDGSVTINSSTHCHQWQADTAHSNTRIWVFIYKQEFQINQKKVFLCKYNIVRLSSSWGVINTPYTYCFENNLFCEILAKKSSFSDC